MKLACIGAGNMGSAILGGIIKSGLYGPEELIAAGPRDHVSESLGVHFTNDNSEAVRCADTVLLAVKPQVLDGVLAGIRGDLGSGKLVLSIVAGRPLDYYTQQLGEDAHVVRAMPNTPALVGEAMTAVTPGGNVTEEERRKALGIFQSFGKAEVVPEKMMDAVTAVSGSSPAYVFMFIEAMADAAVAEGMPRQQAYTFAAQAVYGSAKMVLATGKHPAVLKDMVCSPAGTTIEAVKTLEKEGFRNAVIAAVASCAKKSREM